MVSNECTGNYIGSGINCPKTNSDGIAFITDGAGQHIGSVVKDTISQCREGANLTGYVSMLQRPESHHNHGLYESVGTGGTVVLAGLVLGSLIVGAKYLMNSRRQE